MPRKRQSNSKRKKSKQSPTMGDSMLQVLKSLPYDQKIQAAVKLSHRANERIRALERKGLAGYSKAYKIAALELGDDKPRFSEGKAYKTENLLDIQLANLTEFLESNTSSLKGARKSKAAEEKRIQTFAIMYGIEVTEENKDQFFDFLNSARFTNLSQRYDSNQIIENIADELEEGYSMKDILKSYGEWKEKVPSKSGKDVASRRRRSAQRNGRLIK